MRRGGKNSKIFNSINLILAVLLVAELIVIVDQGSLTGNPVRQVSVEDVAESGTKITGTIETIAIDDFENTENSRYESYIITDTGERIKLELGNTQPLISGTKIEYKNLESNNNLVSVSSGSSSLTIVSAPSGSVIGEQRTLIIVQRSPSYEAPEFRDLNKVRETILENLNNYYFSNSYHKITFSADIVGPYTLPSNSILSPYQYRDYGLQKASVDVDLHNYNLIIFLLPSQLLARGQGTLGRIGLDDFRGGAFEAGITWSNQKSFVGVITHELGHNFGLFHSNLYKCYNGEKTRVSYSNNCLEEEYGDTLDVMGNSGIYGNPPTLGYFNTVWKTKLGWMDAANIIEAIPGNTYLLRPQENIFPLGEKQRLNLGEYSLEFRYPLGYDTFLSQLGENGGIAIITTPYGQNFPTYILDMHSDYFPSRNLYTSPKGLMLKQSESWTDVNKRYRFRVKKISSDGAEVSVETGNYGCLDIDKTGYVDKIDLNLMSDYIFNGKPIPADLDIDLNNDGVTDILDVIIMTNYFYRGAASPCQTIVF